MLDRGGVCPGLAVTREADLEALRNLYDKCIRGIRQQQPRAYWRQLLSEIAEFRKRLDDEESSATMRPDVVRDGPANHSQ